MPRGPRACRADATGCRSVVTDFQPTQEEPCLHFVPSCGEGVPRLGANVCPELPSGRGSWPWSQDAKLDCLKDTSRPGGVCQPWHPGVGCLGTRQELAAGVQERAGWRLAPAVLGGGCTCAGQGHHITLAGPQGCVMFISNILIDRAPETPAPNKAVILTDKPAYCQTAGPGALTPPAGGGVGGVCCPVSPLSTP